MHAGWTLRARAFASENKLFMVGSVIFLLILLAAVFAEWIAPYSPTKIAFAQKLQPPSLDHLMGTDKFGRDIFSRVLYGAQTSLAVGALVTLGAMLIGTPIGLISGYFGGKVDTALMRISDVFLAFPPIVAADFHSCGHGARAWSMP